jgi:hypothetical protein
MLRARAAISRARFRDTPSPCDDPKTTCLDAFDATPISSRAVRDARPCAARRPVHLVPAEREHFTQCDGADIASALFLEPRTKRFGQH